MSLKTFRKAISDSYRATLAKNLFVALVAGWVALGGPVGAWPGEESPSGTTVDFSREIRPILSRNCLSCHGADEGNRQVGLRLDTREGATADRGGYRAIVPGKSAESRMVERITHPDMPMPPEASGKKLKSEEIELIKRWIDEGAPYNRHWAFQPPSRPALPEVTEEDKNWVRNEIDHFVLARLEKEGMTPSAEADRYTLIRRVYLDLIGLPPTPEQVVAFVKDDQPGAYERVVVELLNSPHYGERWARVWLDLARYADSQGYEKDNLRVIWPYRDWVVRALNENMPFDRFTLEQLAGDLVPVPTQNQLIATGFHRNTMTNTEGGTDDEEFRDQAVRDRVATTMQVWMGLTAGCAQCHSHKYDPLTHREFYQLYSYFDQSEDSDKVDDRPTMKVGDTSTLIMRELAPDKRRTTHILERGNFLTPGEEVSPEVPKAFHPFPKDAPSNRLGLAKWLTDKNNPLTARVTVNRFWAKLFGAGLVQTEEDFGTQGNPPSHPKLLDWIATEFMRLDWDMKAILKTIVLSATYRQSSDVTPERFEKDRYNRLLARGPRFRLEAELIRDQALAVGGLLSSKMYGAPVMPLQPEGVWQTVYSNTRWETSDGEDRYRRGLYTFWRRTSPYPSMVTLDATSREVCTLRRIRTNTPLQALVTLNDPVYVEAAVKLARRVMEKGGSSPEDRARYAFRLCLVRSPRPQELAQTLGIYEEALRHYEERREEARKLIHIDRSVYLDRSRIATLLERAGETAGPRWKYTREEPGSAWMSSPHDDGGWDEGAGAFGKSSKERVDFKGITYPTEWITRDIWLRRSFELPEEELSEFTLKVRSVGKFEVYINGELAAETKDERNSSGEIPVREIAAGTLRPGENLIAVHAWQPGDQDEGRVIDVGMMALRPKAPIPVREGDAEHAAWTMVGNVLLNLDETLTKR